jgi:hypothetical protein
LENLELRLQQGAANARPYDYTEFAADVRNIMAATGAKPSNAKPKRRGGAPSKDCENGGNDKAIPTWHDITAGLKVLASLMAVKPVER